jgi:hypothetical protein
MKRSMVPRMQIIFVVIFLAACVGLLFLHPSKQPGPGNDPRSQCEAKGLWWDELDKVCATPTPLTTITGHAARR